MRRGNGKKEMERRKWKEKRCGGCAGGVLFTYIHGIILCVHCVANFILRDFVHQCQSICLRSFPCSAGKWWWGIDRCEIELIVERFVNGMGSESH